MNPLIIGCVVAVVGGGLLGYLARHPQEAPVRPPDGGRRQDETPRVVTRTKETTKTTAEETAWPAAPAASASSDVGPVVPLEPCHATVTEVMTTGAAGTRSWAHVKVAVDRGTLFQQQTLAIRRAGQDAGQVVAISLPEQARGRMVGEGEITLEGDRVAVGDELVTPESPITAETN